MKRYTAASNWGEALGKMSAFAVAKAYQSMGNDLATDVSLSKEIT
jgi:hypothetical protein